MAAHKSYKTRNPACDACRRSKVSCDHQVPCARCKARGGGCDYRSRPFKRKKALGHPPRDAAATSSPPTRASPTEPSNEATESPTRQPLAETDAARAYPNPGFLGPSSHVVLFSRLRSQSRLHYVDPVKHTEAPQFSYSSIAACISILKQTLALGRPSSLSSLVECWMWRGTNLCLAEPFVSACLKQVFGLIEGLYNDRYDPAISAESLLASSSKIPNFESASSLDGFCDELIKGHLRLDTLGYVLIAIARASIDTVYYTPCYTTEEERRQLQRQAMAASDACLECCISLDCLNDLLLILQYEIWILHSHVDGDQSFQTWRRLGDVIGAMFALGLHQGNAPSSAVPKYLSELRKAAFARIYTDDKNVSVFLGRPPRVNGKFCVLSVPGDCLLNSDTERQDQPATFTTECTWLAWCAALKEEALDFFHQDRKVTDQTATSSDIVRRADELWSRLPSHLCIESSTALVNADYTPFQRDFVISARLNYLHVHFLVRQAMMLQSAALDGELLKAARQMLSVVVQALALKDHIVNSGTGLVWKVAHYGLPAAGVLALHLLSLSVSYDPRLMQEESHTLQEIGLLVAAVQMGAVVQVGEPNYALLRRAAQTLEGVLQMLSEKVYHDLSGSQSAEHLSAHAFTWDSMARTTSWDFGPDFWQPFIDQQPSSLSVGDFT